MAQMDARVDAGDRAVALLRELDSLKTDEPMLAPPWERAIARMIDAAVVLAILVAITVGSELYLLEEEGAGTPQSQLESHDRHLWLQWALAVGFVALAWAYEAVSLARWGTTLSKRRVRLIVVDERGRRPSLARASLRWAVLVLPLLACWELALLSMGTTWVWLFMALQFVAALVPLSAFWTMDHRGWHDRIAGTTVLARRD